jgi:protocatechuate 3,4-dioxygenase alpha subunit
MKLQATSSQTAGPFVHLGTTDKHAVGCMAGEGARGERIDLRCFVADGDGSPVTDAVLEIWQADASGKYAHPEDPQHKSADPQFRGSGRLALDDQGSCKFHTIKPGQVPAPDGSLQAPHINVSIFARGLLKRLVTRIYFAGDPANASDPVLALVPSNRRETLLAKAEPTTAGGWRFDIRLCCESETVFFDV